MRMKSQWIWVVRAGMLCFLVAMGVTSAIQLREKEQQRSAQSSLLPKVEAAEQEEHVLTTGTMIREFGAQDSRPMLVLSSSAAPTGKKAYLTFDDGPSLNTRRILHILQISGIKATFFVIGKTDPDSLALYKAIADEGHALGNHTFSHRYNSVYASVPAFKQDVEKLNQLLEQTAGVRPSILRFPGGSNNRMGWKSGGRHIMAKIAREMSNSGYQYFDWNVSSTDAASAVQPLSDIISSVKAGSQGKQQIIVLMHDMDAKTTTVEALPEVIRYLKNQGFAFDVLTKSSFNYHFLEPEALR
ncbi:polysaccharide deacetylase family protein [Paenibacillus cremeus]|nr:polysaccharide deacetylase family protein [Paenibacillus cremeus]